MTSSAINLFFSPRRHYFVLGASRSPEKYGNKVLKWYIDNDLPVTPVNPDATTEIYDLSPADSLAEGLKAFSDEEHPEVSVSVVTAPNVTLREIQMVADNGVLRKIESFWLQPGTYDSDVIGFLDCFGFSKANNNLIYDGDCILVSGSEGLKASNHL
ncbi:DEKNAAC102429 [Brettanomyces naardenensis]|uniref:DEKNAAC102429 n=1 Tax=Brettanomyces naardenensis TaxID=13370 RepID=A0A448YKE7_BRENA|nr:DEKNAAC102429 [Brettanomyces naardenensis]